MFSNFFWPFVSRKCYVGKTCVERVVMCWYKFTSLRGMVNMSMTV